jgi:hypothetical protein
VILKVTIAFAAALLVASMCRRASAATRHAILVAGQLVALALPLLMFVMPPLRVERPGVRRLAAALPVGNESGAKAPHSIDVTEPAQTFDWRII